MRRAKAIRSALVAHLGVLLCAGLLAGCTDDASPPAAQGTEAPAVDQKDEPAPSLDPEWTIKGWLAMPDRTGTHHWATHKVSTSGISRGTTFTPGPILLVDARTGKTYEKAVPGDWPCKLPRLISDGGATPVLLSSGTADPTACSAITVWDASSGKTMWSNDALDLTGLSRELVLGADDRVVVVVDVEGKSECFATSDGEPVTADDPTCTALRDRLTGADLPELTDPDGSPVPWPFNSDSDGEPEEIGRTDEVLLVRTSMLANTPRGAVTVVRAHDLETGETLWQDADLTPDPHGDPAAWTREETYAVAPSGLMRVSYEHPEAREEASSTPMVLTAVDPRTGEDRQPVARVEGAWFNRQFGDTTVALTEQDLMFDATISGFRLPTW